MFDKTRNVLDICYRSISFPYQRYVKYKTEGYKIILYNATETDLL